MTGIQYPESVNWLGYNYDEYGRLQHIGGITAGEGYRYNNLDLLESVELGGDRQIRYQYDAYHRPTGIGLLESSSALVMWELSNEFDEYGNITAQTQTGSYIEDRFGETQIGMSYAYDGRHRLTGMTASFFQRSMTIQVSWILILPITLHWKFLLVSVSPGLFRQRNDIISEE